MSVDNLFYKIVLENKNDVRRLLFLYMTQSIAFDLYVEKKGDALYTCRSFPSQKIKK